LSKKKNILDDGLDLTIFSPKQWLLDGTVVYICSYTLGGRRTLDYIRS